MKSVGEILKQERLGQNKTLAEIHRETKIPHKTLLALERGDYSQLPPATFIKGFISIYAQSLGLSAEPLLAIFRRDWQKIEKIRIVPQALTQPAAHHQTFWTPKTTIIITVTTILAIFIGFFGLEVKNFYAPPKLTINFPADNQEVTEKLITLSGNTNTDASIYLNDQLLDLDEKGNFATTVELTPGENTLTVKAINRRGKASQKILLLKLVDKNI